MKAKFLFAIAAAVAVTVLAPRASAAACSSFTTLDTLLTAGSCNVGSVTFNNFSYANTVAASSVNVAATGSGAQGSFAGLAIQTSGGWVPDFSLTYTVTCNGCTFLGAQVNANIQPVFGNPAASMTLTFTDQAGTLTPTAATQNQGHAVNFSTSDVSNVLNAGGPNDNLQSLQNNFYIAAPTPEPTSLTLFGGGLMLLGFVRMRRK